MDYSYSRDFESTEKNPKPFAGKILYAPGWNYFQVEVHK